MVFFILKNSKSIYVEIYIADWFKMGHGVLWELVGFLYGKIRTCMLNLIYILIVLAEIFYLTEKEIVNERNSNHNI